MRCLVHISDLHFGHNDPGLIAPLREAIEKIKPNLMIASGDFVEHATTREFEQAHDFLDSLPHPQIVVPGNHDLAFYDFVRRYREGLRPYRHFIDDNLSPEYRDEEIMVLGANTARLFPIKGGRLNASQFDTLLSKFSAEPSELTRVLVTHHPFDLPEPFGHRDLISQAKRTIAKLSPAVDILLAGHMHISSSGSTATRYRSQGHAVVFVQAGTAVSNRNKGEVNSFNVLRIDNAAPGGKSLWVDRYAWSKEENQFACHATNHFQVGSGGWSAIKPAPAGARSQR